MRARASNAVTTLNVRHREAVLRMPLAIQDAPYLRLVYSRLVTSWTHQPKRSSWRAAVLYLRESSPSEDSEGSSSLNSRYILRKCGTQQVSVAPWLSISPWVPCSRNRDVPHVVHGSLLLLYLQSGLVRGPLLDSWTPRSPSLACASMRSTCFHHAILPAWHLHYFSAACFQFLLHIRPVPTTTLLGVRSSVFQSHRFVEYLALVTMFSSTVRAALIALAASAVAVSAERGLSLKVTGPEAVDGVDNLKVTTVLTNTGDETLKLLNDPRGALHSLPANTFDITTDSGERPSFVGVKVKYVPSQAAKSTDKHAFTVLAPGQSISLTHDLSAAYNFTKPGAGKYTVEPSNLFHIVDPDTNEVAELRADTETHVAAIAGKLAVVRPTATHKKRATFNGCSSSQQSGINSAVTAAESYAANAHSYLQSHTSATTRYTTWFGAYTSSRHNTVLSHFTNLDNNDYSTYTYDCTCTDSGTYAYVYPDDFGHVYFCGAFWQAPTTGTDSKAGTIIHESSHFTRNGGTDDIVYGQTGAKNLAKSNPDQAIRNADSHEYFAENNPAQS